MSVSPLAPRIDLNIAPVGGVRLAAAASGVKYKDRDDVMLAVLDPGTSVAGVFTKSSTRAAPVLDCQEKIGRPASEGAAILVNAGNANAFTGTNGREAVAAITAAVAKATGLPEGRVFTASTGVIGEVLDHGKIRALIGDLVANLAPEAWDKAAPAILTTDTFPKVAAREVLVGGSAVRIAGFAKGSGMIQPDMATMLAYVFTDARIGQDALQDLLARTCDRTFNCITVDSDTSTSDTLMAAATGASDVAVAGDPAFEAAFHDVLLDLAQQIVRDGEGASKFVTVRVDGAKTGEEARTVALAIANSPLVKTAIAGEDPNWGRIVMAVGKSGAHADRDRLSIRFGDVLVAENGWVAETYREEAGASVMKEPEIEIAVDLGIGTGSATVWTCDLTKRYIEINADYRS